MYTMYLNPRRQEFSLYFKCGSRSLNVILPLALFLRISHSNQTTLTFLIQVHHEVFCDRIPWPDAGDAGGDGEREAQDLPHRNCGRRFGNKLRFFRHDKIFKIN